MNAMTDPRISGSDEARLVAQTTWSNPPPEPALHLPPTGEVKLTNNDYAAAALMVIMLIGPLAAAAIGRFLA